MLRAVIIEDNYPVRKGLIFMIHQRGGIEVVGDAADGDAGLVLVLRERPELIITDIRLPGMSGLAVLSAVRETVPEEEYAPQAIIISAYSEFEYAKEALSLGVIAYLVKPIDKAELAAALTKAAKKAERAKGVSGNGESSLLSGSSHQDRGGKEKARSALQVNGMTEDGTSGAMRVFYTRQILSYIEEHCLTGIRLSDVAEALSLSENYISRIFREELGSSIKEYSLCLCMAKAAVLLEDPRRKIYEVADAVGMDDQRYFSRLFKQHTGMTPASYRDMRIAGHAYHTKEERYLLFSDLLAAELKAQRI